MDPKKALMKTRKIKALLIERGIKQVTIAKDLGVSTSTVSKVVAGDARSRRVEEAVAALIGHSREALWG
jgi:predicted transcriptional regulator